MKYNTFLLVSTFLLVLIPSNAAEMEVNTSGDLNSKDTELFSVHFVVSDLIFRMNITIVQLRTRLLM